MTKKAKKLVQEWADENKEELKSYMVDRLKTSITGESQTYEPVVMENDKLM